MAKNSIQSRRQRYFKLSSEIAQIDNVRLHALFEPGDSSAGWGRKHTLELAGGKVFVKRVPVTDIERDNLLSTRNLYDLPTYYNYGVGSGGMGVFRELVANIKTTNWVLDGQIETFPLLYHYRIVPLSGEREAVNKERHQEYVDYWGGNENINRYMLDKIGASYELVFFLEHVPHVLHPWLYNNPGRIEAVLEDLRAAVDFLRKNGIIHFDAHFHNILTDGERPYLTDFGLVLDKSFTLTEDETAFFKAHTHYDYGEILSCLAYFIFNAFEALSESEKQQVKEKYGIEEPVKFDALMSTLIKNIEAIHADGVLKLDNRHMTRIARYHGVIDLMHNFYSTLRRNPKKDTKFPHAALQRLLKASRLLP